MIPAALLMLIVLGALAFCAFVAWLNINYRNRRRLMTPDERARHDAESDEINRGW